MNLTGEKLRRLSGIYCFIHRDTGMCYVGSSVDIGRRVIQHRKDAQAGSLTAFHKAWRLYGEDAFDLEVLERCDKSLLIKRERFYIVLMDSASVRGFNTVERPGFIPHGCAVSAATRERLRVAQMGKKRTPQARQRMRAAQKGKVLLQHVKEALLTANIGSKHSPDHIAKRVQKIKGQKRTDEFRERCRMVHLGKKRTDEAKEKMRLAKLGRKQSPEHIAKRASANRGQKRNPHTEETKARMRESRLKFVAKMRLTTLGRSA